MKQCGPDFFLVYITTVCVNYSIYYRHVMCFPSYECLIYTDLELVHPPRRLPAPGIRSSKFNASYKLDTAQ